MKTLKIARLVFQNDKKGNSLMLPGGRKQSFSGWLTQAQTFYRNLLADAEMAAAMGKFGYTAEKLNAEAALVADVSEKSRIQAKETGEAQAATQARDKKIDELDKWLSGFRAVCRIALDENRQKLEELGILVLNAPRRAKKKPAENTTSASSNV
jgi:hypothetical protein